jgi:HemY protein
MIRLMDPASAEKLLRELLDRTWDEEAVTLYGEIETPEPLDMLTVAERWLRNHGDDAALLLTCARLCIRAELYGKARSYLEASLAIKPRLESYLVLASLADQLGDRDRAIKVLNDALIHAIGRKANVPKVRARRPLDRRNIDRRKR